MPFQFRLESVLAIRTALEEQALRELAGLNAEFERTRLQIRGLDATKSAFLHQLAEQRQLGEANIERILADTLYLERLNAELQGTKQVLRSKREAVRSKRSEVVKKTRERQVLEKLKEKHRARYEKEIDRKEATEADELFLSRYSGGNAN